MRTYPCYYNADSSIKAHASSQSYNFNIPIGFIGLWIAVSLLVVSCGTTPFMENVDAISIKGTINGYDGTAIYIKRIDPLGYHTSSLMDSTLVTKDGTFEFEIHNTPPFLLSLSKYRNEHPIHHLLRNNPELYYYGYCARFYIPEPTVYLTTMSDLQINWTASDNMDAYKFEGITAENQTKFYNYYSSENFFFGLYDEDLSFKKLNQEQAWTAVDNSINRLQEKYNTKNIQSIQDFDSYLDTEIVLGGLNMYLTWLEAEYLDELKSGFKTGNIPQLYSKALHKYRHSKWNHHSVEFYKMTERFVTFNLNKTKNQFNEYYPWSTEKASIAKKVLNPVIAKRYIENLSITK